MYVCILTDRTDLETGLYIRVDGKARELTWDEWDAKLPHLTPVGRPRCTLAEVFRGSTVAQQDDLLRKIHLYDAIRHPHENGFGVAGQLIEPLRQGIERLRVMPFNINDSHLWGSNNLLTFLCVYMAACMSHPDAAIRVEEAPNIQEVLYGILEHAKTSTEA